MRQYPRAVVAAVVVASIAANALLMEQYRKGRIPVDDTMSWQAATEAGLEDWFDGFGYPFSFPMNWLFALRYDRPKTQYDILVGKYLFHRYGRARWAHRPRPERSMAAERELFRRINLLEIAPLSSSNGPVLAVDRVRFERLEP